MPQTAAAQAAPTPPIIGTPMIHIPTGTLFRVLCSCPSSKPVEHTRRFIERNPTLYRHPTVEELQNGNP